MEPSKRRSFPNGRSLEVEAAVAAAAENGVELDLGLSTNGRFGSDPATMKKLKRSSSVSVPLLPNFYFFDSGATPYPEARGRSAPPDRTRASSVPTEIDENEIEARRRSSEARRQRVVKMKMVRSLKSRSELNSDGEGSSNHGHGRIQPLNRGPSAGGSSDLQNHPAPVQGTLPNPITLEDHNAVTTVQVQHGVTEMSTNNYDEFRKVLEAMPYVSTRGYGPNQVKIEGFLYKYSSSDDLKIMCVCHGLFLTPAEFVKHGGGSEVDVAQALKQIVLIRFPYP